MEYSDRKNIPSLKTIELTTISFKQTCKKLAMGENSIVYYNKLSERLDITSDRPK